MCGRFYFGEKTAYEVEKDMGLKEGLVSMGAGDVTPAMNPIVFSAQKDSSKQDDKDINEVNNNEVNNNEVNNIEVKNMFWGLEGKDKKLIINARAESVLQKPMFSGSIEQRRIIIPAAGFYEWDKDKNKVTFYRKDKSPIYFAGFYQLSQNRDSFVILTTAANESMIKVHDRMPLMIEKGSVHDWLCDTDAAKEMLSEKMPLLESHQDYEQLSLF